MKHQHKKRPKTQPSWAQLYRLNELFSAAEKACNKADYAKWNDCLDRIYIHLCIDDKLKEKKEDEKIQADFAEKIFLAKKELQKADKKADTVAARSRLYHLLLQKDIWLRKILIKENTNFFRKLKKQRKSGKHID